MEPIVNTAAFWASVGTLWATSGAWFTFYQSVKDKQEGELQELQSFLSGLKAELSVVSDWASGKENAEGYVVENQSDADLFKKYPSWSDPGRVIFPVKVPIIENFTASPHIERLTPLVMPFVRLGLSISKFYDLYSEYRKYVLSRPDLFVVVRQKQQKEPPPHKFSEDEVGYIAQVFGYNRQLHVEYIGGKESKDPNCLFNAFRTAEKSLRSFEANLKKSTVPRFYKVLNCLAWLFVLGGLVLVMHWWELFPYFTFDFFKQHL